MKSMYNTTHYCVKWSGERFSDEQVLYNLKAVFEFVEQLKLNADINYIEIETISTDIIFARKQEST